MKTGDILKGRYRVDESIGRGGSAEVFAAEDLLTGEARAVKALTGPHGARNTILAKRLQNEAKAMAAIAHPNVLRVHDVGDHEGCAYIVMDRAKYSLIERIDQGPLEPAEALSWMLQVLSALAIAHDNGLVHRDVKPQNILINQDGRVVLADFGIALLEEGTRYTRVGSSLGSLAFMPPEQRLDASSVDHRADIYAAGATLYHLVTARNPVDLFMEGPTSPRFDGLPDMLRSAILRSTRHNPDDRYPEVRRLAAALTAARAGLQGMAPVHHAPQLAATETIHPPDDLDAALAWLGEDFVLADTEPTEPPELAPGPSPDSTSSPPLPVDEPGRLAALLSLAILDTGIEERFDRHTRLAQRLFGVPIALVSLVDRDRQWFKSVQGLDARETPREHAFCAHAINTPDKIFEVQDASTDPRFRDNPLVTGAPDIRFYAGMPILGPKRQPLGTVCIIGREPRALDKAERALLADIAAMVQDELRMLERTSVDDVTGISDRAGFKLHAQRVLGFGRSRNSSVTLVHLVVEKTSGGSAQPDDLRFFAGALDRIWPDAEVVARTGDAEFCVMATGDMVATPGVAALHDSCVAAGLSFRWSATHFDPNSNDTLATMMARADSDVHRHLEAPLAG